MAQPWSSYRKLVVETYYANKPGKSSKVHARPVEGQLFPTEMDVECSRAMRKNHPIGTKFRISVKETDREGGKPFLYTHHSWPYEVVE